MCFVETPRKFVFEKLDAGERDLSLCIKNFAIINLCGVNFCKLATRSLHVVILPNIGSENSRRSDSFFVQLYFLTNYTFQPYNIFGNVPYTVFSYCLFP